MSKNVSFVIIFLLTIIVFFSSCSNNLLSSGECKATSYIDNYFCYVPRIDPDCGFVFKLCNQNTNGSYRKSCKFNELDDERFIFVRAEYKDGIVTPSFVEVTPLKLEEKDPFTTNLKGVDMAKLGLKALEAHTYLQR